MSGPKRLGTLLDRWRPAQGQDGGDPINAIAAAWPDAVGPDVASRTRPGRLRDGTLTVFTAGSTWSHQLSFLAPGIVDGLLERCPGSGVKRLRFIVATGRTKALLDGLADARGNAARRSVSATAERADESDPFDAADPAAIVERLRRRQQTLDRRRERDGWTRCAGCGAWRRPTNPGDRPCAVCSEEDRRTADNRVERIIASAPWLRQSDVASHVPDGDDAGYERVRRRLLARWEEQMHAARRRLRRGELQAADRVIAWSYLMLLSGMQQHAIGRAVVLDVLGPEWAEALIGHTAARDRKATASDVQKQRKTNARVFTRRDTT
jgi:predicted nucleic acid-binding Zn ribbon protein